MADTYTVTSTADGGPGTLREAITYANSNPGADTISFNIPASDSGYAGGVWTIAPRTALPTISGTDGTATTIDGFSQPGANVNTLATGSNAVLKIEIKGIGTSGFHGLTLSTSDCLVKGLSITNTRYGIYLNFTGATRNTISGNTIGLSADGTTARPNTYGVISYNASGNTIGGSSAGAGNIISGNSVGVYISGSLATGNTISGNTIGLSADGTTAHPNGSGVYIGASGNTIGGSSAGAGNVISGNSSYGVAIIGGAGNTISGNTIGLSADGTTARPNTYGVSIGPSGNTIGGSSAGAGNLISGNSSYGVNVAGDSTGNSLRYNSIHSNGTTNAHLGIDLNNNGVTLNDEGDGDTGANNLQNFPVLTTLASSGGNSTIGSTLNSSAGQSYVIDFYDNDVADPSGYGEGKTHIGSTTVTTDSSGNASFSQVLTGVTLTGGHHITATATRTSATDGSGALGDTSEFSRAITVEAPSLVVTTTSDATSLTDGLTSLREAITYANSKAGDDAITFDIAGAGPHIIQLDSALPALSTPVTITGPTDESVTVDGGDQSFTIFTINTGVSVGFKDLTISNGLYGIDNNGTLTVTGLTLSGNDHGIVNQDTLTVTGSTLSGNSSNGIVNSNIATVTSSTLSGNYNGIWNYSTLTVTNSTLSGNGGGMWNFGTATITNSTLSGNSNYGIIDDTGSATYLTNSIVAGNSGYDLDESALAANESNLIGVDPKLGLLQDNGGPTQTHALLYGSPAMEAGNDALAPATDQRGVIRPQGSHSDIGAYEAQQYQISGYVRTNALTPIADTTMTLQSTGGVVGPTVQTDANGFYTFSGLPADSYTVTPTKTDWSFTPASQALSISTSSRGANFVGARTAATYNVSGRISTSNGTMLAGVSVALTPREDGVVSPVTTNGAGYYTFTNVPAGDYTITPSLSNYTFSPPSHSITVNGQHVSGKNFIGATGHKLIGRVMTSNGAAIAGVTVTRTGAGSTPVTTNSAGYYTFTNVPDGNITITPSKNGYIFTPTSKTVVMSGGDVTGQNFIGATGFSVTGRIATSSGVAMSGVAVQLDNGPVVTTNSAGYYTFTGVANGQHTLTPSKTGYSFAPEQKTVQVNGANVAQQNFTGTATQ